MNMAGILTAFHLAAVTALGPLTNSDQERMGPIRLDC